MPIKSVSENPRHSVEFVIGRDVDLVYCSESCLLRELDQSSRVVRTGQSEATALTVIIADRLLVSIAGTKRTNSHILGEQKNHQSSRENWKKLVGHQHSALVPVHRVCDCMGEIQILDGEEFEDAATIPAWKKVRSIGGKSSIKDASPVTFDQWRTWMGELAQGLHELEQKGLAHGDPYPFNAIRTRSAATWIDFGHLTDDPSQYLKDAWAFVLFTILHTHRVTTLFSPSLLKNLAIALRSAENPGRFERIKNALHQPYEDLLPTCDVRDPSVIFSEAIIETPLDYLGKSEATKVVIKSSIQYFSDLLHHIQLANIHYKAFHLERQRHVFTEQEMLKLTVPKAQHNEQIKLAQNTIANQEKEISQLRKINSDRNNDIYKLKELISKTTEQNKELNRAADTYRDQALKSTEAVSSYQKHLNTLLASRSWQITRPMRALARLIRNGRMPDSDLAKIYSYAKRIHHRIPISYEAKLVLRSSFLKITGWKPNSLETISAIPFNNSTLICGDQNLPGSPSIPVQSFQGMRALNNRSPYFGVRRNEGNRRVAILTNQLLDWNDNRPRFGGGERYALELARLLKDLSFDVTFFQPSFNAPGEGSYYGFRVVLLSTGEATGEFHHGVCDEFTRKTNDFDHVYHHLPEYSSGSVREDALMTCHGIWFDHDNYPYSVFRTPEWFQHLYFSFSSPRCVVSVDTNSIGVMRSLWPKLASNMRFIPNFYDATSYFPRPELRNPERLTVLFPRRSQINRGSRIFSEILSLIPHDVDIIWLGEGDPLDTQIIKDACKKDRRASFAVADFDQMPGWYQKADIAVIPTIACEGTSLSCIEALAAGCAVVSTNVGGLPDIIYDGMNGLLVHPNARSIAAAINCLIIDRELRERLQRSAAETAHNFELKNWRRSWVGVLHEFGWITDRVMDGWNDKHVYHDHAYKSRHPENWLILTRNAIHGGVESLIREEAKGLGAPVVVCGGHDKRETCPFEYTRADNPATLERIIQKFDIILYHWLPDWCLEVLRKSGKRCIEFVHRTDTSESDKSLPMALVTHSAYLARYIFEASNRSCRVIDHAIAIDRFKPTTKKGKFVGAITSYYDTKGIDVLLKAWAQIKDSFPDYQLRFYGAGEDLAKLRNIANELAIAVDFKGPTSEPWSAIQDFACFVVPSRIEGLPVAILEALAMNIPVVASDLPGMVEFNDLSESRGYSRYINLAKKDDAQDFAVVISHILSKQIEPGSSEYIKTYYSPTKHCADLITIYREFSH